MWERKEKEEESWECLVMLLLSRQEKYAKMMEDKEERMGWEGMGGLYMGGCSLGKGETKDNREGNVPLINRYIDIDYRISALWEGGRGASIGSLTMQSTPCMEGTIANCRVDNEKYKCIYIQSEKYRL